ncbi:hypothetical protein ACPPVT_03150 [Angustibacter sp. McL0619]|uniref:hypothetical protein n=1 Tax=Angustibacter sp. McL0619 TaxID=3415676 RepID=UPI003CF6DF82
MFSRHYGNTRRDLADAYGRYEHGCEFGAVLLGDGTAVAAVRLLRPSQRGLKSLRDAAGQPWCLPVARTRLAAGLAAEHTWDVATFGVDSDTVGPGRRITIALMSVMFGAFRDNGVTSFVAILDTRARRSLAGLGLRMHDLPGALAAPYLGSPASVPVYRHVAELHAEHADRFTEVHAQAFHGTRIPGLDECWTRPGIYRADHWPTPRSGRV